MKKAIFLIIFFLILVPSVNAQDISGSKDHPLITRYPGSTIGYYEEQKFIPYKIAAGPQTGYRLIKEWVTAEGKLTRIYYIVKGETTLTEVYRNYLSALNKSGFKIIAQGIEDKNNTSQNIGGRTFLVTFYNSNPFPVDKNIHITQGSATSGGSAYVAGRLDKNNATVFVVVGGSQYQSDEKVFMVDIIEQTAMEGNLIHVNADAMLKSIQETGRIALYNIFFDFDKANLKPESKPALDEIKKLLDQNARMNLFVVGHTDAEGALDYNISLSKKRAEAVVAELVKTYGINVARLKADGIGPLAPVSTNRNDEGRKLNRRVELVER